MGMHYFVGAGIASLAGAAFLIRDGGVAGQDIVIFEEAPQFGGALDAQGSAATGYHMCGSRMFESDFQCTAALMDAIPSLSRPHLSVREESECAAVALPWRRRARVLDRRGAPVDASAPDLDAHLREALERLMIRPESELDGLSIEDCLDSAFFETGFWLQWCTTFALKRWHSAKEFRRHLRRFARYFDDDHEGGSIYRTIHNQYESLALPLKRWLREQGVAFRFRTTVTDLQLLDTDTLLQATALECVCDGQPERIALLSSDRVFLTLGGSTAGKTFGSMVEPAILQRGNRSGGWRLWEALAARHPQFGRPQAFDGHIHDSSWLSFMVTAYDRRLLDGMRPQGDDSPRTGELIRFKDSAWLLTLALYHQPFFQDQPDNVFVLWGYGHFHDRPGDFVRKPMLECSGQEILEEVLGHLHLAAVDREHILATSNCIPCAMPYASSSFLPRRAGDRPAVVPPHSVNVACLGQFVELPDEVAMTVEYSVRSAQLAVYRLLGLDRCPPPATVHARLPWPDPATGQAGRRATA